MNKIDDEIFYVENNVFFTFLSIQKSSYPPMNL